MVIVNLIDQQKSHPQIAVVMTCHNRRDITMTCLQSLDKQRIPVEVYLVDDGSTDGTSDTVRESYPKVNLIQGSGSLFWSGGMRVAFSEAIKKNYDYYIWLNDDTLLNSEALSDLLNIHLNLSEQGYPSSIVVGSTQDPVTGKPTYGGAVKSKRWYSNKLEFLEPSHELQKCDTMYGNCVLIPRSVVAKVGNIDSAFIHALGDIDYGLRAIQLGCSVWAAPGFIGTCAQNSPKGSWIDCNISVVERLQKAWQVKNFPVLPWTTFTRRHSGFFWFLYWFLPYIRAVIGYKNLDTSPTFSEDVQSNEVS
ncbi:MAG: glycosyltransferase family 2 protein [Pleurocapsa sp.]